MLIVTTYSLVFILFIATFLAGKKKNKHDFLDIIWGVSFVSAAITSYVLSKNQSMVGLIMTILITLWGIRLTYHLSKRNINAPEDYRYVEYRKNYTGNHFDLYFFFRMYVLQFVLSVIIGYPAVYVNINGNATVNIMTYLGVITWMIGFLFESIGDYQLKVFIADSKNKGKLMTTGLWQYTRHPNYFGEATQWWGIYLIALSNISYFWLIFSPLLITLLLLFVSGIPMLEKKYEGREDWEVYKAKTSVFFPLPPKRH